MNILEVNKFFYQRRGAERHFLDLIDRLKRVGHSVAVFTMDDKRNVSHEYEQYSVSYVGYNRDDSNVWERWIGMGRLFWSCEARRKMKALIRDFRPDVVHVHNSYHQLSLSFFPLVKQAGIPLIMTVHDYVMISPDKDAYYPEVGKKYWKFLWMKKYGFSKRLLLVLKKYWEDWYGFYDSVDRFLVPSRFVENILLSVGVKKEKITVLPHFISETASQCETVEGIMLPPRYLFFFGAISEEKGIRTLLKLSEIVGIPLVLAGKWESGPDLAGYPEASYIGMRTKGELNTLITGAAAVVNASTLPETFGLAALETIALGKPYFAFDTGALSEIIQNGFNGFLAQDEVSLTIAVQTYLSGAQVYAGEEDIRKDANERFGEEIYMKKLEGIVKTEGVE